MKNKLNKLVYVDNAATTKVRDEVVKEMLPFFTERYGNPSSLYNVGFDAAKALNEAREKIAKLIGAKPNEIIFTSGGSESDNTALRGIAAKKQKGHIITTNIEHHAISHTLNDLEKQGFEVTYLPVSSEGLITAKQVEDAIREDTILITIMTANNEIGTIMPIKEIGEIAKAKKIPFHTDAVQAVGHMHIDVKEMNIDLMSASAHKFNGPKGVGFLYCRGGVYLKNFITGGAQERNKRAGTENVAGIVGMAKALEIAVENMDEINARLLKMRERLIDGILNSIEYSRLNGSREKRMPSNVNVSIEFIEGESLILTLNMYGICASSGSACTTGSLDPSHVLLAIGLSHDVAHGSLRISLGEFNDESDVDYILEVLPKAVKRLRDMSPLWDKRSK